MKKRIVMKFGGTSVGSANAIRQTVRILKNHQQQGHEIAVVVSAVAGVTNNLNDSIIFAQDGQKKKVRAALSEIRNKIATIANELLNSKSDKDEFAKILAAYLLVASKASNKIAKSKGDFSKNKAELLSIGERIQIHLIEAVLNQDSIDAIAVHSSDLIVTDSIYLNATPQQPITDQTIYQTIDPLLQVNKIPVISGFVAANEDGVITTLGRGGSDYTAGIIAAAIEANEVWIWTDVDGILTTDPALVADAKLISEISYDEVYDLAYFGAKVLHPKTILPIEGKGIPVRIKNTFNEQNRGTYIHVPLESTQNPIKAVTGIKHVKIISIRKRRNEDLVSLIEIVKSALENSRIQVLGAFNDSAKDIVYLAIKEVVSTQQLAEFEVQLEKQLPGRNFPRLSKSEDQTLVTAVGHGIQKNHALLEKLKFSLSQAGVNPKLDSYQNTDHSFSFLISDQHHLKAIHQIHNEVLSHA